MRTITRRRFAGGISALFAAPALTGQAAAQARFDFAIPRSLTQGGPTTISRVPTAQPLVAMTFDDGPHQSLTPHLLDMLRARNIRATFYLIGRRVAMYPELTRRIAAAGHEIGNHTWSHSRLTGLGNTSLLRELDRTSVAINAAVGRPPITMRPPYGLLSPRQRRLIYAERRFPTVLWSVDPRIGAVRAVRSWRAGSSAARIPGR